MSVAKKGFTLVELLVVIAIIGVLVALLLPAVQAAREAARRSQCMNHQKQLGLALHNHHDIHNRLPPGGASDQPPFGTATSDWGSSWLVYILPYMEQNTIYEKWQFNGSSGVFNNSNNAYVSMVQMKQYVCPSSPLPKWARSDTDKAAVNYVGISGANNGLIPGYTESRIDIVDAGGAVSAGGVLISNGQLNLASVTDGTSNVLMVSEHSDFMITQNGTQKDWRASQPWGWSIGCKDEKTPPDFNPASDNRPFNHTTIRYAINQKRNWPNAGDRAQCKDIGVCDDVGANIPLNSPHPGGVTALYVDGSVHFLSQTTPLDMLARLATRDDGQVVNVD